MITVLQQHPLAPYTTFGIGGPAEYFVYVRSVAELQEAIVYAQDHSLSITVLGGGSNVLVHDKGISGLVIKNELRDCEYVEEGTEVMARVGSGCLLDEVIAETVTRGYWGLENLSHIPGTIGATPVQNVGAYGVEVSQLITAVEACDLATGELRTFTPAECTFGYRDSFFKTPVGERYCITRVSYRLSTTGVPHIAYKDLAVHFTNAPMPDQMTVREAVIAIRNTKFPDWNKTGTAGSFFKNPIISTKQAQALRVRYPELPMYESATGVKLSLSWLLDKVCHLKGVTDGPVGTHVDHVLVVVNHGGATYAQVQAFAAGIQNQVQEVCGVNIQWEVTTLPKV